MKLEISAKFTSYKKSLKRFLKSCFSFIDLVDFFVFGGLGMIFYGIHQLNSPLSYVIVGGLVFWMGMRGNNKDTL